MEDLSHLPIITKPMIEITGLEPKTAHDFAQAAAESHSEAVYSQVEDRPISPFAPHKLTTRTDKLGRTFDVFWQPNRYAVKQMLNAYKRRAAGRYMWMKLPD